MIVFPDDMIVYVENPKEFMNKLRLAEFNRVFGYKTNIFFKKQLYFSVLYASNGYEDTKIGNKIPFTIT